MISTSPGSGGLSGELNTSFGRNDSPVFITEVLAALYRTSLGAILINGDGKKMLTGIFRGGRDPVICCVRLYVKMMTDLYLQE